MWEKIEELYDAIHARIQKLDFGALWQGFRSYEFALYTGETVYFSDGQIPWDERFLANTTISYEGRQIAIWNIEEEWKSEKEIDVDVLTAGMVHEMFHAFQAERGETRFPDDIEGLDYPMEAENFRIKYLENKTLAQAFLETEPVRKKDLLREFVTLRDTRTRLYGKGPQRSGIRYESLMETMEGMAEYVGTKALRFLSEEKYRMRMEHNLKLLRTPDEKLFDVRWISYYVGTVLLLTAEDAELAVEHEVGAETSSIFELVARALSETEDALQITSDHVKAERQRIIHDFMEQPLSEHAGRFEIHGYDPLNMFKLENHIYGSRFFMLSDKESGDRIQLLEPVLLELDESGEIIKYFKRK